MLTYTKNMNLNQELIKQLLSIGDDHRLSDKHNDIAAQGREIIPALIEIVKEVDAFGGADDDESWVPIHAVIVLGQLKAEEAIDTLLKLASTCEWDEIILSKIMIAFGEIGAAVLNPALEGYANASTHNGREMFLHAAASTGILDPRIFEIIQKEFNKNPAVGAGYFACYGDKAALPILINAFNAAYKPEIIDELAFAIKELGGILDSKQERKAASARRKLEK